jgi:hypothetical protein
MLTALSSRIFNHQYPRHKFQSSLNTIDVNVDLCLCNPTPVIYAHGATQSSSECILSENIEYIRHSQRAVAVQFYFPNHGTGSGMAVDDIPNRIVLGDCYAEQNSPQLLLSISSDHWVVLAYL